MSNTMKAAAHPFELQTSKFSPSKKSQNYTSVNICTAMPNMSNGERHQFENPPIGKQNAPRTQLYPMLRDINLNAKDQFQAHNPVITDPWDFPSENISSPQKLQTSGTSINPIPYFFTDDKDDIFLFNAFSSSNSQKETPHLTQANHFPIQQTANKHQFPHSLEEKTEEAFIFQAPVNNRHSAPLMRKNESKFEDSLSPHKWESNSAKFGRQNSIEEIMESVSQSAHGASKFLYEVCEQIGKEKPNCIINDITGEKQAGFIATMTLEHYSSTGEGRSKQDAKNAACFEILKELIQNDHLAESSLKMILFRSNFHFREPST